jgi:hypothetical protein
LYPLEGWTPGALIANYREIKFGTYLFPLSVQESARDSKLKADTRSIPYGMGDYQEPTASLAGRDITIVGDMGSGLQGGVSGVLLVTASDLEIERAAIGALQAAGRQKLWVRPDRYINAFMNEFSHAFMQDGGAFRFATWTMKFKADDPRYYSTNSTTVPLVSGTTGAITQAGNMRAYPVITIGGPVTNPVVTMIDGATGKSIAVTFTVALATGDTLVLSCDPRPEIRRNVAKLTLANGTVVNALQYVSVPSGFANNLDASEMFPFLQPAGNSTTITITAGGTYSLIYSDTWL